MNRDPTKDNPSSAMLVCQDGVGAATFVQRSTMQDKNLDPRVWQPVFHRRKDGSQSKFYVNKITGTSFEFLHPSEFRTYSDDEFNEMKQEWKKERAKFDLFVVVPQLQQEKLQPTCISRQLR